MKKELLNYLIDPFGNNTAFIVIDVTQKNDDEIIEATLKSEAGNYYPIINGIPRIMSDDYLIDLAPSNEGWFLKYKSKVSDVYDRGKACKVQVDVAKSFGEEWKTFDDILVEYKQTYNKYFSLWEQKDTFGEYVLDAGCGMGRWARYAMTKSRKLFCIDISQSIDVAQNNLKNEPNIFLVQGDLNNLPFPNSLFDSIYSLGVLHHIPNYKRAFGELVRTLNLDGNLLTYLYYSLDNRPFLYRLLFTGANLLRIMISKMPKKLSYLICYCLTISMYYPLIFLGKGIERIGLNKLAKNIPIYDGHKDKSFYHLFCNTVDRFTTPLEKRFSREDIIKLYSEFNLEKINIQHKLPYYVTAGTKRS
jgi:ubiquinone/menaquinone biosynthesis C-methylase UbiE/uncharacterized protein YbaR (Trm112 family)